MTEVVDRYIASELISDQGYSLVIPHIYNYIDHSVFWEKD